jgi:hypothetical protein
LLLALFIFHAAQRGIADLYARHVRYQLDDWEKARKPVVLDKWREALASAEAAHRLNPRNPDSIEDLGRIYDWAAFGKPVRHPLVLAYKEQALVYFRAAARERPVSGYTWANIAQTKLALSAVDEEFARALQLGAFFAPWEPEVQLAVADAGLATWTQLGERSREIVLETAARALKHQAKAMLGIAEDRGRTRVVCELAELPQEAKLACR